MQAGFKKGVKLFKHLANKQLKGVDVIGVFEWIFSGPVIGALSQNNAPHWLITGPQHLQTSLLVSIKFWMLIRYFPPSMVESCTCTECKNKIDCKS